MSLVSNIRDLISQLIPTDTRIIVRGRQQEPALAHTLSVDSLAAILRTAESGDPSQLFAVYRDILGSTAHLQGELQKRKLAVLGQPLTFTTANPKDAAQVDHAASIESELADREWWLPAMSHCLDSALFPVSLMERWYAPSDRPGWRWTIGGMKPVPHNHLVWPDGIMCLRDTDDLGQFTGTRSAIDPRRFFAHRSHLLSAVPDWWGGPMRSLVFWWLFSVMDRDWWIRFLDRFGAPFLEGRYDPADERGRYELESAFSAATRLFGIVVSNETEVKMHQANAAGTDAFEKFHAVANREMSKLILGQTLSAEGQNLGLGGGQAGAQADVREDIRVWDATCLAQTIRTRILQPLWRLNGWTIPMPSVSWGSVEAKEAELNGDLVSALAQAGIRPTVSGLAILSRRVGFGLERVSPGSSVALSSLPPDFPSLVPAVSRRAARSRQARAAVDAIARRSAPQLARLLSDRAADFSAALSDSTSADDAAARFAALSASYDPALVGDLIERVLASSAVAAAVAWD